MLNGKHMKLSNIYKNIISENSENMQFIRIIYKQKGIGRIHWGTAFERVSDSKLFEVSWRKIKQK